jgi:hypothetical protein
MMLTEVYKVPIGISLSVVAVLISGSIVASLLRPTSGNEISGETVVSVPEKR